MANADVLAEVFVVAMVLVGLAAGSFINVVASRLPRMMEAAWRAECMELTNGKTPSWGSVGFGLVHPPSACPACGHRISPLENIPVLSYAMLGGRCSACRWRIPARYPMVEMCGAVVAGAAALHFGFGIAAAGACVLGWGLLAAGAIDLETRLLPDSITLPLLWSGLAFNLPGTFAPLVDCVIGAMAGYGVLWAVHHGFRLVTGRDGMGHGDFKLLASLGAWLGWQALPGIVLVASLAAATAGIALAAHGQASRDPRLPFGPFLATAGLLMLYCGDTVTYQACEASGSSTMWHGFMTGTT